LPDQLLAVTSVRAVEHILHLLDEVVALRRELLDLLLG